MKQESHCSHGIHQEAENVFVSFLEESAGFLLLLLLSLDNLELRGIVVTTATTRFLILLLGRSIVVLELASSEDNGHGLLEHSLQVLASLGGDRDELLSANLLDHLFSLLNKKE